MLWPSYADPSISPSLHYRRCCRWPRRRRSPARRAPNRPKTTTTTTRILTGRMGRWTRRRPRKSPSDAPRKCPSPRRNQMMGRAALPTLMTIPMTRGIIELRKLPPIIPQPHKMRQQALLLLQQLPLLLPHHPPQ